MTSDVSAKDVLILSRIVELVRSGVARTRSELTEVTGLGRAIVNDRLAEGLNSGLLADADLAPSGGGRRSRTVRFRAEAGAVLGACLGGTDCSAAVADLNGTLLATAKVPIDVTSPAEVMASIDGLFRHLMAQTPSPVWGITIGVPAPVDIWSGRVVSPTLMPGWDEFDVRDWFRDRYEAPVWVDNDVNLMALGEWRRGTPQDGRDLLFVKVDTDIGSGLITAGRLHRGNSGAAGDIGHVRVVPDPAIRCRCGKTGCLEAIAGGWALVRSLSSLAKSGRNVRLTTLLAGRDSLISADIGTAAAAGDHDVIAAAIEAGDQLGRTVAGVVNFANPGTLVIGGGVLRMGEVFFDHIRSAVVADLTELASRGLVIRKTSLGGDAGVVGAVSLAVQGLFDRETLASWVALGSPLRSNQAIFQHLAVP